MTNIFIHPGFGKTGTTCMQNNFFDKHPSIFSIGRPYTSLSQKLYLELINNSVSYNEKKAFYLRDKLLSESENKIIVLSDETLCNNILRNKDIIPRLYKLFPSAQIFFTIRSQFTAIVSYYANHGRILKNVPTPYNGKHITFNNWFDFESERMDCNYMDLIRYTPVINLFAKTFVSSSIHIFLYEILCHKPQLFAQQLEKYLNLTPETVLPLLKAQVHNKRDSQASIYYKIFREYFIPNRNISKYIPFNQTLRNKFMSFLASRKQLTLNLNKEQTEFIYNTYRKTNKLIMSSFNLQLNKWGYPI